jgi:hypothetical protein
MVSATRRSSLRNTIHLSGMVLASCGRNLLGLAAGLAICSGAQAADQGTDVRMPAKVLKLKAKPQAERPFFLINDNRITYSWYRGAIPGFSAKSSNNAATYTHFDAWAYGTNLVALQYLTSDHSAPTAPCVGAVSGPVGQCAGATFASALVRSTLGWNELFDTKAFSPGFLSWQGGRPLRATCLTRRGAMMSPPECNLPSLCPTKVTSM